MVDKLKVVLISSGVLPVPPIGYGGLENIVYDLAAVLDMKGHEVHVVAPSDSKLPGNCKLIDGGPCSPNAHLWESQSWDKYQPMMFSEEFKGAIWHDHSWAKAAYFGKMQKQDLFVVSTLHGMLPYQTPPPVQKPCLIGISKHHADSISAGLGIATRYVYNGINLERYKDVNREPGDRYLFLARITPFKGAHTFVDLMKQIGAQGDLVGDDILVEDQSYVERTLLACGESNGQIRYWGGVSRDMATDLFRKAKVYILPCNSGWQEPFGLTVVESMACGCPVVATRSGAIPELITDNTGVVVDSVQDLPKALQETDFTKMTPEKCREQANKYSREAMTEGYIDLYKQALNGGW